MKPYDYVVRYEGKTHHDSEEARKFHADLFRMAMAHARVEAFEEAARIADAFTYTDSAGSHVADDIADQIRALSSARSKEGRRCECQGGPVMGKTAEEFVAELEWGWPEGLEKTGPVTVVKEAMAQARAGALEEAACKVDEWRNNQCVCWSTVAKEIRELAKERK